MSEQSTEAAETPEATQETEQKPDTEQTQEVDYKAEAEKWQALARKHEERAKSNAEKAKGFDELKRSQMTEQEKAVDEARVAARAEAIAETTPERVRLTFEAIGAGRLTEQQIDELLEDVDMTKYLTETGAVDRERVARKVNALAPAEQHSTPIVPDLGQGVREPALALNGDPLLADLKSKLGIG
jgi:hypothetical protein